MISALPISTIAPTIAPVSSDRRRSAAIAACRCSSFCRLASRLCCLPLT